MYQVTTLYNAKYDACYAKLQCVPKACHMYTYCRVICNCGQIKVKGRGIDLCLVNGQGHYVWSLVKKVYYDFKVQVYSIIQSLQFSGEFLDNCACHHIFGVSDIVSLAAVPMTHQETIMECRHALKQQIHLWTAQP